MYKVRGLVWMVVNGCEGSVVSGHKQSGLISTRVMSVCDNVWEGEGCVRKR